MLRTITLVTWTILILLTASQAFAGYTNFPAGSYIIPMDPCWQPNTDTAINPSFAPSAICDSDQDDRGVFQAYGLVYEILRNGGKVSWVVNPTKTTQHDLDFIINGVDSAPVIKRDPAAASPDTSGTAMDPAARTISWATNGTAYSEDYAQHVIDYRGGPFVIHQKYLTGTIRQIFDKFPHVKIHIAQKSFSAPVDKILDTLPPKIAILGGKNTQILRNYLLAAGLGVAETLVFDEVTPFQILNDALVTPDANGEVYSLFWAPHWVIMDEVNSPVTLANGTILTAIQAREAVLAKLRQFLEAGNSSFLECASIESVEGSENGPTNLNPGKDVWESSVQIKGGWLTKQTPANWNTATPAGADKPGARLWVNDGSNDEQYVVFDSPSSFLAQCAGWEYVPTGGHVHNYKPHFNVLGKYNSSVERFVHDGDGAYNSYNPGFDYYTGGRINGSPDMGYSAYLAGHSYIECNRSGTETSGGGTTTSKISANETLIAVAIKGQLPASEAINFRVFYDNVVDPVIANWKADGSGHINGDDATIMVSLDKMTPNSSSSALGFSNILLSNMDGIAHTINKMQIDWSGCATGTGGISGSEYVVKKEKTTETKYCDENKVSEGTLCVGNNIVNLKSTREFEFEILEKLANNQILNLDFIYTLGGVAHTLTLGIKMKDFGSKSDGSDVILNLGTAQLIQAGDPNIDFDLSQLEVKYEYDDHAHTIFKKIKIKKLKMIEHLGSNAVVKSIKASWSAPAAVTCLTLFAVKNPVTNTWTADTAQNTPINLSVPLDAMNNGGTSGTGTTTLPPAVVDVSYCDPKWRKTNTCGTRFVLNTVLGLQFTLVTNVYVQSSPIIDNNVMYIGSYENPGHKGHLQAIDILGNSSTKIWDAVDVMPVAGAANPGSPSKSNTSRYVFTNNGATRVGFDINSLTSTSGYLFTSLGLTDLTETKAWINTLRGRSKATATNIFGTGEQAYRLWGVRESGPAIVGEMKLRSDYLHRDLIVYVGADDGMLHAFYAGSFDASTGKYTNGTGKEAWAYIPSTLLPQLKKQNFTDPNVNTKVSVSGSPAVGDFYVDKFDNSGTLVGKEWRTILIGTANIDSINQGILFALDVTDPYAPQVLWEKVYPNATGNYLNMGNSKGVAMGSVAVGDGIKNYVYLTSSYNARLTNAAPSTDSQGNYGINAYAIDMLTGDVAWHFNKDYVVNNNVTETPAIPALLDIDENGNTDYVVFGDMDGRLWVLDAKEGKSIKQVSNADAPVFPLPGNGLFPYIGPIGSSVALYGNTAIFATGGTEFSSNTAQYGVYATQIFKNGEVNLLWSATDKDTEGNALFATGEKIWSSPQLDQYGNIYLSTGVGHSNSLNAGQVNSTGKIHILDKGGVIKETIATESAAVGNIALTDGGAVAVDFTGTAKKLGTPVPSTSSGGVNAKVYSWRLR